MLSPVMLEKLRGSEEENKLIFQLLKQCINKLKLIGSIRDEDFDIPSPISRHETSRNQYSKGRILKIMLILLEELKSHNTYGILKVVIDHETQCQQNSMSYYQHYETLQNEIVELQKLIDQKTKILRTTIIEKDIIIDELTRHLNQTIIQHSTDLNFEKTLLQVQEEENILMYKIMEKELKQRIINIEQDSKEEIEVHLEILWYYKNENENIEKNILLRRSKFVDISEKEKLLQVWLCKEEDLRKKLDIQKYEYYTRKTAMDEFLKDKEQRKRDQEFQEFLNQKATIVQAWWRGIMVQKYLGPYNVLKAMYVRKRKFSLKKGKK